MQSRALNILLLNGTVPKINKQRRLVLSAIRRKDVDEKGLRFIGVRGKISANEGKAAD